MDKTHYHEFMMAFEIIVFIIVIDYGFSYFKVLNEGLAAYKQPQRLEQSI